MLQHLFYMNNKQIINHNKNKIKPKLSSTAKYHVKLLGNKGFLF